MTDRDRHDRHPDMVGQVLQFEFPQTPPLAIAASAVGGDQQLVGVRVEFSALAMPPPPNRRHSLLTQAHPFSKRVPNSILTLGKRAGDTRSLRAGRRVFRYPS